MFRSTRVQILVAVIFGLIAAFLVWRYTQDMQLQIHAAQEAVIPTPIPTTDVLVAAVDLPSRTLLTADMVKVVQLPNEQKLSTALSRPDDAIGKVTQYPLATGEQILSGKFSADRTIQTFSYVVPPGKRAIAIVTSEEQGAGGLIAPGDHIDVIAAYDPILVGGVVASTILQNVLVLAVSQSFVDQAAQATFVSTTPSAVPRTPVSVPVSPKDQVHADAKTITLALSPKESQQLFLAELHGQLRYVLRSVDDAATDDVAESVLTPTLRAGQAFLTLQGLGTPGTATASQSSGESPLTILDVKISPNNLHPGDVMKVEVTVKNTSNQIIQSQGPDPEYTYVQGQTYYSENFPSIPGKFRIGMNFDAHPSAPFPYRWGFGGDLGPGASTTVVGLVKMTGDVKSTTYWTGLIEEPANVVQDSQGATLVTVLQSGADAGPTDAGNGGTPAVPLTATPEPAPVPTKTPIPTKAPAPAKTPTKTTASLHDPMSTGYGTRM